MAIGLTGNIIPKGTLPDNNKLVDSTNVDFGTATTASTNGLATLPTSTTDSDGAYFAVSNSSSVQKKLTKGNISLAGFDNSATGFTNSAGTVTSVGTGTGLSGTITASGTITLDLDAIADMTETWDNAVDEFIVLDDGVQKKKLSSEIFGSNAFNSTNFIHTAAEVTALLDDVATYTLGNGSGTITVSGDLTVTGTTTTVNTEEILLADNQIVLNSNYTGTIPTDGGIELERGDYVNTSIFWDESENRWYGTRPNHNTPASANGVITGIIPLIETAASGTAGTADAQKLGSMFINTATSAIYIYA